MEEVMKRSMLIILIAIFVYPIPFFAQKTHPFSVQDLVRMKRIQEAVVSADGNRVALTVRETDMAANRGRTDIWQIKTDGSELRRLTFDPENDSNPCWAPDGTLWFLSSRSGSSQVWRLPSSQSEAVPVTRFPLDVNAFWLSPNGKTLLVSVDVFSDGIGIEETAHRLDSLASIQTSGKLYNRLFFRHWDAWSDGRRSHLFSMPVTGGEPVDIMSGLDADVPSKPFGGNEDAAFTPDGSGVVFSARNAGREEAWSTNFDLFYAPIDGAFPPVSLTPDNPASDSSPVFSPDGHNLAYLAMARPGYEADRNQIMIMSWPDCKPNKLAPEWDRSPSTIRWSKDGKSIFTAADHLGQHALFTIDVQTGRVRTLVGEGTVKFFETAGEKLVVGLENHLSPVDLVLVDPQKGSMKSITSINAELLSNIRFGQSEQFQFIGANNDTVWGYVVKPVDFDRTRKYPVALLIHGGPQGSFGNDFHYRWNPQTYAGAGYAAVMIDFHGSTGYGQAFCDSIRNDWGGKPLEDLQKGLDYVLKSNPWMDGNRVAALGASYGGYMVNWIAGNWPDRFRCLVSHDGNLDERMAYFDTEELWFPEWDHAGTPWDNPEHYEKQNPLNFIKNWKTPMLIVHGGKDYRVVETQGMSTFTALQRKGIPSQFLYFPDENHWVLKPGNSILWHDTVIAWLDRWLKDQQ
jgi:dipeptidyl aminopeptidase/acylaminoacyl peptidase